jgi:predicted O-methyltransferase YrrM
MQISRVWLAFREPRHALAYLVLGSQKCRLLREKEREEESIARLNPSTPLEERMVKRTDIRDHLATIYMLTVELNLRTVLELGTRGGESTIALLEAAKSIGGIVHSVDIEPCVDTRQRINDYGLAAWWNFIQSDDLALDWRTPIDHLFIDTSHSFEHTCKELAKFEPLVNVGGAITLHDIVSVPEVEKAVQHYCVGRRDLRIYRYYNNNGLAVIFKKAEESHGGLVGEDFRSDRSDSRGPPVII